MDKNTIIALISIWISLSAIVIRVHMFDFRSWIPLRVEGKLVKVDIDIELEVWENIVVSLLWPITIPILLLIRLAIAIVRVTVQYPSRLKNPPRDKR